MPGAYTFYNGSTILQPLANRIGIEVDKLNLVLCQFISLPLAYLHYYMFTSTRVSRTIRLACPAIFGLLFCYFCFGKFTFIFAMGYLVFIHWYRWYILTTYYLDITGPMMILVQKVTTLAFSLHDGRMKKSEELNNVQKKKPLRKSLPDVLSFLSYMFHFQAVLTGPACFYTDYIAWIDGTAAVGKDGKIEKPWRAVLIKLLQTVVFILLYVFRGDSFTPDVVINKKSMNMSWIQWLFLLYIVMAFQRVQYYLAWTLADAIYNLSGFGFRGYNSHGEPQWDLVSNIRPWKFETALNFKETLEAWNCCTMYWLRRVAYDRAPKGYRTLSTYLLSAVWHGFFLGYYVTFLTGALFTVSARTVRRCLRWRFQGNKFLQRFYDLLTFVVTKIFLCYAVYPFVNLHLGPGLYFYSRMYFCLHIIAFSALFVLPRLLPPEPNSVQKKSDRDMEKLS
ncbi:Membrane-bound O-acyltransferase domain-containing protein 2 [Dirofilaria immitis]|nr:Membrane-bound O-acyltransferase domain-containing protein 2 [Dirofilaria immitis]